LNSQGKNHKNLK